MAEAPAATARIYVGRQSDFLDNSRQLVKHGVRNIAVVFRDGRFYAFDNACYHHGGALLRGDIEDLGGHPCIVCPWHSYHITMDTGEGLYVGVDINPEGGKPRQAVKSKGKKQRVYPVTVEANGCVYVEYDTSGPRVESDTYATMAIANQEEATSTPIVGGNMGGTGRGPRLHSSGGLGVELRSGHVFQAMHAGNRGGQLASRSGGGARGSALGLLLGHSPLGGGRAVGRPLSAAPTVCCTLVESVCTEVKQFSFMCCEKALSLDNALGKYVELELPIRGPDGRALRRKWTISATHHKSTSFTVIVKRKSTDPTTSGSAWLHQHALHTPLPLCRVGGELTMANHSSRIRAFHGRTLWLTAGIGITSAYANVVAALTGNDDNDNDGGSGRSSDSLHILHLHVDRYMGGVAKLPELVELTRRFPCTPHRPSGNVGEERSCGWEGNEETARHGACPTAERSYTLRLFLTKAASEEGLGSEGGGGPKTEPSPLATAVRLPNAVMDGRRYDCQDILDAAHDVFGAAGSGFLSFLCGPPSFVGGCTSALLTLGVAEPDILTDDP